MIGIHDLGQRGEKFAARYLRRRRYRIVCRNYRCRCGEIDIVALDGRTIVFVEVKTRASEQHADVIEAITPEKQQRLSRAARYFLHTTGAHDRPCRFDAVTVVLDDHNKLKAEHIEHAFDTRSGR